MAWIELHQSLWTHRKTFILAAILGIDELYAAAHMSKLWTWALDNAQNGDLTGLPNKVIAFGAGWTGDENAFVDALVNAGWIDQEGGTVCLHDWYDYAGRLIEKKEANKERAKRSRNVRATYAQQSRNEQEENAHVAGLPNHTLPNHTLPNHTKPLKDNRDAAASGPTRFKPPSLEEVETYCRERNNGVDATKWYNFYAAKGWMIGKNKMKDWKRAVITWERSDGNAVNGRHHQENYAGIDFGF